MNALTRIALSLAVAAVGSGFVVAPTANALTPATTTAATPLATTSVAARSSSQEVWQLLWRSTIPKDYLESHGNKWVSGAYRQPTRSTMARGTFLCSGGGKAELTILDLDWKKNKKTKTGYCDGKKRYVTVRYERNHHMKVSIHGCA